ncbi:hypothetical protein [Nonomuraea turcica]|uniref:hypothetical protein n=1 Tax=Nonomuraea sp. G32 TaxID=3067274 RepID=UPI00273A835B|nr:hypothetical protein [Nonomuraea sp. G32]MDP4501076.1 hypothetical protein [Nonomuraea sp. G32]
MARKSFQLQTEPHVAEIGDTELLLRPEVMGDEFLDMLEELQATYRDLGVDLGNVATLNAEQLKPAVAAVRRFLAEFMLPESAELFAGMRLPDRILVQLLEWVIEIYGGGSRPTGSSSGSATPSPPPGSRGSASSRSKASTRARGR